MTEGFFTRDGEPAVSLQVRGPAGTRDIEAVIDTGFNGELTLPPDLVASLGLPLMMQEAVMLGDGSVRAVQMYAATVVFAGRTHTILVDEAATTPLVGTDLLRDFSLHLEFWTGGRVEIRERPEADR